MSRRSKRKAGAQYAEIAGEAARHGVTLRVADVSPGCTHWMFDGAGARLADYWPTTGTLRAGGANRKVGTPTEALHAAVAVLKRRRQAYETPPAKERPQPKPAALPPAPSERSQPRGPTRQVMGVTLEATEGAAFGGAVKAGKLVIEPWLPCASLLPVAWRRWCESQGREAVIEDRSRE